MHCEKCWRKDRPFGKMGSRVSASSPLLDYRIKIPSLLIICVLAMHAVFERARLVQYLLLEAFRCQTHAQNDKYSRRIH